MKRLVLLFVFTFLLVAHQKVYCERGIKIGKNYTVFKNKDIDIEPGYTFGLYFERPFIKKTTISWEILCTNKKGNVKNAIVTDNVHPNDRVWVSYNDISCSVIFLEIPIFLKYYIPIKNVVKFDMYIGPSLSLGIVDKSSSKLLEEKKFDWNERYRGPVDYILNDETLGPFYMTLFNSGLNVNIGAGFQWSSLHFEFRYSKSSHKIQYIKPVQFYEKISHSYYFIMGITL